ncbi:arginine deiminase family protein [Halobacillus shinanisalinarum]|uniref:Arginine deiminase family protein n=1 Tax=Halobacillus shinanisalinarum TaxID=2932258 RepID=A0ABY4GW05_9BACI|nr:arginine deiminase family protein [Halobacillus shinanisalinarum]UOQ92350.1 arginine deiminase family protein [Halobacillus shinanisalinarum]
MCAQTMYEPLRRVIVKHPKEAFLSQNQLKDQWKSFHYIEEPHYERAIEEYEQFLGILKKHVDEINYLPASEQTGIDSLYAHDPVKFTSEGAVLLRSGKASRQPETKEYKHFLQKNNLPILGELTGGAMADGGDLVWLDDRTLAIGRGYRTNDEGIHQLKELLNHLVDDFVIVPLPHDQGEEECLHLMSLISIVDRDLAVVYSPLMPVFFRQLLLNRGISLIEIPKREYLTLGCNVLALAPRVCIIPENNEETKRKLEEAGTVVYTYAGDEISYKGTGGPTCLTAPVIRG